MKATFDNNEGYKVGESLTISITAQEFDIISEIFFDANPDVDKNNKENNRNIPMLGEEFRVLRLFYAKKIAENNITYLGKERILLQLEDCQLRLVHIAEIDRYLMEPIVKQITDKF